MLLTEMLSQYRRGPGPIPQGQIAFLAAACLALTGCPGAESPDSSRVVNTPAAIAAEGDLQDMDQENNNDAGATVAAIRRDGNHLKGEHSLYLRQHAHNPVDWYPWGSEALDRARREGKLIFLSIGYSSCHWCHVMEEEVFEDDAVAAYLNEHFVCIKVDREERPDIDAVYMTAVQMMAGNGGWPLNVFLTPQQEPFFGGTYFPVDRFMKLVTHVAETYESDPGQFREVATELANTLALDVTPAGSAQGELSELPGRVMQRAWRWFDDDWGGFGSFQKFPTPPRWRFALHYYRLTGDTEILGYLVQTLDAMAGGGIYDHIGGGFHRYTVDREWVVPHFEKMLYDNAQLTGLYFEAAAATGNERYSAVARDTLEFLLRDMHDPAGGFYSSYDADSGGEEGTYYVWTPAQLAEVAGAEDGAVLARLLGVTAAGNFEGSNVLTRRSDHAEIATEFGLGESEVGALFDTWRTALRDQRAKRVPPGLDKKLVTAWNAMAIEALVAGFNYLGEERYLREAETTAGYLWDNHRRADGSLYRASTAGVAASPAILDDYALFASALLMLFQATGNQLYLDRARSLVDHTLARFRHPEAGFFLTPDSTPAPLGRQVGIHDSVEPSGNAVMLRVLRDLAVLTGDSDYLQPVNRTLAVYLSVMEQAGFDMAVWHDLALLHTNPLHTVVVAGVESAPGTELLTKARATLAPYVLVVPVAGADGLPGVPQTVGKSPVDDQPVAYVCEFGSCQSPTTDPQVMLGQVRAGWRY